MMMPEESLEALIERLLESEKQMKEAVAGLLKKLRAITAEHSNGKGKV
jgi:hypothetical protein